jgi:hypothetical protein
VAIVKNSRRVGKVYSILFIEEGKIGLSRGSFGYTPLNPQPLERGVLNCTVPVVSQMGSKSAIR